MVILMMRKGPDTLATTKTLYDSFKVAGRCRLFSALLAAWIAITLMGEVASAQVSVTATAGTLGPTTYTTLKGAFDAINLGTHQDAITVSITGDTTETATAALNASGLGPTVYTSVFVAPSGGGRTITGAIAGAVIKLDGADNVTLDGRIGGVGRNLTVSNTSAATDTAVIWLASVAVGNGARNNVIRNLEIAAGTDSSVSSDVSFGILMSGATISTTSNGEDNDNNAFIANRIIKSHYGLVTRGNPSNPNDSPTVTDNIIGPAAFGSDQLGRVGIFMQGDSFATVARNTVQFAGCLATQTCTGADRVGIAIGSDSWSVTGSGTYLGLGGYTVTRNVVRDIVDEKTFSAIGVILAVAYPFGPTSNLVANNMIFNIRANATSGHQMAGIAIGGGSRDTIAFNSIVLTGDVDPGTAAASTIFGNGIRMLGSVTNLSLKNNSIYMDVSSSSNPTLRFYAITGTSAAYSFGSGGEDYNNYYINPSNPQLQTAGLGTAGGETLPAEFATLANWQTAYTASQDANSIQADPQNVSNTNDLHISGSSPNLDAGLTIAAVTDDIDGSPRPLGVFSDIGADEGSNTSDKVRFSSAAFSATELAGIATIAVLRLSALAVQVNYSTVVGGNAVGGASCAPGVDYVNAAGVLTWAANEAPSKTFTITVCNDGVFESMETVNLEISNVVGGTLSTPTAAVLNLVNSTLFNGTVNVGAGESFTSLTNPGGLFEAISTGAVTGNTTVAITSNLTDETGAFALSHFAPGFTLTILPSGGARTIAGSASGALIKLNGADRVTLDGRIGGTGRNLTIVNTNTAINTGAIWLASVAAGNGASNNVIRNCEIATGWDSSTNVSFIRNFNFGILMAGSSDVFAYGEDNDYNSFIANRIVKARYGIITRGKQPNVLTGSSANLSSNTVVTDNVIGPSAFGSDQIGKAGILMQYDEGAIVSGNTVQFVGCLSTQTCDGFDRVGIAIGIDYWGTPSESSFTYSGSYTVTRNTIHDIVDEKTFSAVGLLLATTRNGSPTNNLVANNIIYNVRANATAGHQTIGLGIAGGHSDKVVFNSIALTGDVDPASATASTTAGSGIRIAAAADIYHANLTLKNNSVYLDASSSSTPELRFYAISGTSAAYSFGTGGENHNNYYINPANPQLRTGGLGTANALTLPTGFSTLASWQAAYTAGQDANSIQADPLYASSIGNLHLRSGSSNVNAGSAVPGVTTDIDGDSRSGNPDIGADELVQKRGQITSQ
jgi:hypothetical protein